MGHLGIKSQNNILPNYYPFFIRKVTFGIFFSITMHGLLKYTLGLPERLFYP